jgi:hypothetical protein
LAELERQEVWVGKIAVVVRIDRVSPVLASNSRVSCLIETPFSRISICRRASCSMAWPIKRIELTFLISQRVPSGAPGFRTETLMSARKLPSSILPSQVPR